ncbi:MAG: hypothetical protein ABR543_09650 [Gemmatimonadaceae bacterium]
MASPGTVELRGEAARVVIMPSVGGKISELELGGRQWLWHNKSMPFRPGVDGSSYVETADSGGYDECFPTVGPCQIPGNVSRFGGLELPDHGELWSQATSINVDTASERPSASTEWTGIRMPYRFSRTVEIGEASTVVIRYEATNNGKDRMPFIWSAHPLLPLTPSTKLSIAEGTRARVYSQHGIELFGSGAEHAWPRFRTGQAVLDFSQPDSAGKRFACKVFLEMRTGMAAVDEDGSRLEVLFDLKEVPNFGLWINRQGWTPFRRGRPYSNIAFEPCIGAPDTLSDALGAWNSAHWIEPGDTRRWSLTWRGTQAPADA